MFRETTMDLVERGLNAASLRHQALSHNVANVNTPGYKRTDVNFAAVLSRASAPKRAMAATRPGHLPERPGSPGPNVLTRDHSSIRTDGNNVDIDHEMVNVAENSIYYAALSRQLSEKFQRLRTVISEGRR